MASDGLDGKSWFGLVVFAFVIFFVIRPVTFRLPHFITRILAYASEKLRFIDPQSPARTKKFWRLTLSLTNAPIIGVLILLATTCIDGNVIKLGVVGDEGVRPYDVLVLFICLAYISTSLDTTGGLRAMAFYISQKSGTSGIKIYIIFYVFFFMTGAIFGNDPVVLSGTAFLAYFTRTCGVIPPTAFIFGEFISANIASAVLVSSNPTNVLIAGAFDLNFLTGYTKYTALPSVVTGIVGCIILIIGFRLFKPKPPPVFESDSSSETPRSPLTQYIPSVLHPPSVDPKSALIDAAGCIFQATLMIITLSVLVGTSFIQGAHVWMACLPAGLIACTRDLIADRRKSVKNKIVVSSKSAPQQDSSDKVDADQATPTSAFNSTLGSDPSPTSYPPGAKYTQAPKRWSFPKLWHKFSIQFPNSSTIFSRLPIPLLPFAFSMFILVRSLDYLGWIALFAKWFAAICVSPVATVFFIQFITVILLCPFAGCNIGATIAMVQILRHPNFVQRVALYDDPEKIILGAIFGLAMASNIGAFSVAFSSSLAGLLWVEILRQRGIIVKAKSFFLINLAPSIILTLVSCGIVLAEVYAF